MYREIWILMLIVGILCLVLSLIFFFAWGISDLMDELSGRKAKRQIKIMHEMDLRTDAFDKYSTSDIYSGIPSGSLVSGDIGSISNEVSDAESVEEIRQVVSEATNIDDSDSTSYMDEDATSFVEDEEGSTSYIGDTDVIKLIEEQTSI